MKKILVLFMAVLCFFLLCGFGDNTQENVNSLTQRSEDNTDSPNEDDSNIMMYNTVKNRYWQCVEFINESNKGKNILNGDTLMDYDFFYSMNYIAAMGLSSSCRSTKISEMYNALTGSKEFFGVSDLEFDQIEDLLDDYFSYHAMNPDKEVLRKMIDKYCSLDSITYIVDEAEEYSFSNGKVSASPIPLYIFNAEKINDLIDEINLSPDNFAEDILMLNMYGEYVEFNDEDYTISFSIPSFQQ